MDLIYQTIRKMGVTGKYKGYYLLADAVKIRLESEEDIIKITKDVYPILARKYRLKQGSVEHNLRTVSRISWENNREFVNEIAGFPMRDKFTNSDLINALAMYIETEINRTEQK